MSKVNNNKIINTIILGLEILVILALVISFIPKEANADRAGRVTPYDSTNWAHVSSNTGYNTYVGPDSGGVATYFGTPTVYSGSTITPKATVAKAPAVKTTAKTATVEKTAEPKEEFSSLAANALFGSGSFVPSSLTGWILFAILILALVILVRKIFGKEEAYHATPLKHS